MSSKTEKLTREFLKENRKKLHKLAHQAPLSKAFALMNDDNNNDFLVAYTDDSNLVPVVKIPLEGIIIIVGEFIKDKVLHEFFVNLNDDQTIN